MYGCPSCGANLVFEPKTQKLKCNYCDAQYEPEKIEKTNMKTAKGEKSVEKNEYEAVTYRCTQCGAELFTTDETISTFCSYCGSHAVLEKTETIKKRPDYVIPFSKTKEECEEAYKKKLRRVFFAPKNMKDSQQIEKIRGIYMPYWIYSYEKKGIQNDTGSVYSGRVGDYVYYNDYRISTNLNAVCNGITHDASANFSDNLSEAIGPFAAKDRMAFSPTYLCGYYADSETVRSQEYEDKCAEVANIRVSKELMKSPVYREYNAKAKVHLNATKSEMGLFPVYFLATKNKKGDRISYAVVNGQTGKVAAEIPIDIVKFLLMSIPLSIVFFLILNFLFTITPFKVVVIGIIFSVISMVMLAKESGNVYRREHKLDDQGVMAKEGINSFERRYLRNKKSKVPCKVTLKSIIKPVIGVVLEVLILMLNPVSDLIYYISASVAILATIWSFIDIIKKYNLLTTRKLPQLEVRGGDENE